MFIILLKLQQNRKKKGEMEYIKIKKASYHDINKDSINVSSSYIQEND